MLRLHTAYTLKIKGFLILNWSKESVSIACHNEGIIRGAHSNAKAAVEIIRSVDIRLFIATR